MTSLSAAYSAAAYTWQNGPQPRALDALQARYAERWQIFTGELFADLATSNPYRNDPAIYANTKLLWKHAEAVVRFYEGIVFRGALSDEPEQGAIPIKPMVKDEAADRLMLAINTFEDAWNWQQQMSYAPMYAAALGDCLTELTDHRARGFIYPRIVWPGYVTHIELDDVDNVQGYILEYRAQERQDDGSTKTYKYRKEVDKESFRHYREDQPWDDAKTGRPAVAPNPYGFVPAVWDRHHIGAPGHVRGLSALDGTRQSLLQLNSIFSHAFDFQRKAFFAPIMVAGGGRSASTEIDLSAPAGSTASDIAQSFQMLPVREGAQLLQATFDIGKTREMLEDLANNILAENPEASFYARIREMQTVTAPGVAAAQGDVETRVNRVRAGADTQMVKRYQMAISMAAYRAKRDWLFDANGRRRALNRRQAVFASFDEGAFVRGELDFKINDRPLMDSTEEEKIALVMLKEGIKTDWGLEEVGITDKDERARILAGQRERYGMSLDAGAFGQDFTGEDAA